MTTPVGVAGFNGWVKVGVAANPTNIIALVNDVSTPLTTGMYSTTSLNGGGWETFIPGLSTGKPVLKIYEDLNDTTGQVVIRNAFINKTLLYFIISPNGGTNTCSFTAYVSDWLEHDPVNNVVDAQATLQITGAVTLA